jgi:hypothetical protein
MQRTEFTYGQLDEVLRSLGFSCRVVPSDTPKRVYEHVPSGARVCLPFLTMTACWSITW